MDAKPRSALGRAHDSAMGYHVLVAMIFTTCLPVTLARAIGMRGEGAFAAALDTARSAAAQALSFPG